MLWKNINSASPQRQFKVHTFSCRWRYFQLQIHYRILLPPPLHCLYRCTRVGVFETRKLHPVASFQTDSPKGYLDRALSRFGKQNKINHCSIVQQRNEEDDWWMDNFWPKTSLSCPSFDEFRFLMGLRAAEVDFTIVWRMHTGYA